MCNKDLPISDEKLIEFAKRVGTPFHLYDEKAFMDNARHFVKAFSWAPSFCNFFAVKACPNPAIIKRLASLGFGADCSSLPELIIASKCGIPGDRIVFTSNDTPAEEFQEAYKLGAIINLDDISHIAFLEKAIGKLPDTLCFRYNPGPKRTGNALIGNPVEAKYGVTDSQLLDCYRIAKEKGVKHFGLHTMVASNELNKDYIVETARMVFTLALRIKDELGISVEFVDFGGGIGIPYKPTDTAIDLDGLSVGIKELYDSMIVPSGLSLKLTFECGRMIMGPYGYLVAKVLHVTHKYKDYVGLDASMADLMRPGMYGAYHHETVLGKRNLPLDHKYDVTGSLCENCDKFAIDRMLPEVEEGDYIVIHDTGAHGHSMGYNYNAKLRHAEYLLTESGDFKMIRRAETYDDYVKTLRFDGAEVEV